VAAQPGQTAAADVYDSLNPSEAHGIAFGSLFRWFREREDLENQIKVSKGDLSLEDPQLRAVRKAITGLLLDFSDLRIQRDPLHMVVRKGREELALDQLSHGERLLVAMTADLARRLAIAYHDQPEPLKGEALVLIDEIELHLHVSWQRTVLVRLRAIFPGCQFIVTTHSPQVLSTVPGDAVVLLDNFQVVRPGVQTRGRDSNAILREIFGVEERPSEELTEAREIGDALDRGDVAGARARLEELERRLGWQDSEVIRLKTRLEFLDAPLAEKTSLIFPRFGGRSDYAANAAICDLNSNSIGLT
jgi:predicted ATP-binding protein involved in virulence